MNLICTLVILIVCILSYLLEEPYLVDVAILVRPAQPAGRGGAQPGGRGVSQEKEEQEK